MSPRATRVCSEHGLAYDESVSEGCVLCRRSKPAAMTAGAASTPRASLSLGKIALVVALCCAIAGGAMFYRRRRSDDAGRTIPIVAHTLGGRTGVAYLPAGYRAGPLLVWLHGSGEHASRLVLRLAPFADRNGFALLVPDSGSAFGWQLSDRPGERTADQQHVMDCIDELFARPDFEFDRSQVLVAGFSAGGSSAPALASREEPFTAFAILHGGLVANTIGGRRVRGWLSTGQSDPVRGPTELNQTASSLRGQGFTELEVQTFSGAHMLFDPEIEAMLRWWLD